MNAIRADRPDALLLRVDAITHRRITPATINDADIEMDGTWITERIIKQMPIDLQDRGKQDN